MIKIRKKSKCCGCEACIQICPQSCISLVIDNEGFLYPKVDKSSCVDCGLCDTVCPVINQRESQKPLRLYAAKNPNEEIRKNSSSGGVFTILAEDTISKGGVVFGARFDENWDVIHDYTETNEGLAAFRGSKYVQSRIGDNFKEVRRFLEDGRQVLFSGTPCQVAALRLFLKRDYDNLLLIDLICCGVPSPALWKSYLKEICRERGIEKIDGIYFRDKSLGWRESSFRIDGCNKKENILFLESNVINYYYLGFVNSLYLRPSCHKCPVKPYRRVSQITLGDFWGVQDFMPEMYDDKGSSLIVVNSQKGESALEKYSYLLQEVDSSYFDRKYNPRYFKSARKDKDRAIFYRKYRKGVDTLSIFEKYCKIYKHTFFEKVVWNLKHIKNKF